ncbi:MAG: type II toxin-antitoxin system VapC family toxin [Gemmatimonas sp.]
MKLLLDTHIWLWALLEPERLSVEVREALQAPDAELWLSPVSVWEATLLAERGRIKVESDVGDWVRSMIAALPCREAILTHEIAIVSRTLKLSHEDPADRFLAATAKVLELTLVTADERLISSAEFRVKANW